MQKYFSFVISRLIWCKNSFFINSNSDLGLPPVIKVVFGEKKVYSAPSYRGCRNINTASYFDNKFNVYKLQLTQIVAEIFTCSMIHPLKEGDYYIDNPLFQKFEPY